MSAAPSISAHIFDVHGRCAICKRNYKELDALSPGKLWLAPCEPIVPMYQKRSFWLLLRRRLGFGPKVRYSRLTRDGPVEVDGEFDDVGVPSIPIPPHA